MCKKSGCNSLCQHIKEMFITYCFCLSTTQKSVFKVSMARKTLAHGKKETFIKASVHNSENMQTTTMSINTIF